ncbi:TIGR02530 family flagellar biosynthesis protein [Candidatus Amarobacter glycogenicus]|uniref:TIGR02530 family flagellar biosynthesis protein n=1 Tax=Candidatus Amarobacter glycogenicus TaxID=3140699 RepID=UPI003136DBD8|nr:flagellar biosynthesis protein [Dehalococcoidia bacterium]
MAIDRTQQIGPSPGATRQPGQASVRSAGGPSFQDALSNLGRGVQFSNHAQKRIDRRDLDIDSQRLDRLNSAITRAAEKGARNSVVMLDDLAVVVDIRDRKVVTAINAESGKERVFTNIDSVVIA